jgi:prepilin peptidase CpaA
MFFPDPVFGWVFLTVLAIVSGFAAWVDLRWMVVPKAVTFSCLGIGLAFTLVRTTWLASLGEQAFLLDPTSAWMGLLDGVLFSLFGCGLGFAIFFVLWILGACGGGDVKLFAALGAWIGPRYAIYVVAVSIVVVLVFLFLKVLGGGLAPSSISKTLKRKPKLASSGGEVRKKDRIRLTFSLPVAVSLFVVLLWVCRRDLGLVAAAPANAEKERAHAV